MRGIHALCLPLGSEMIFYKRTTQNQLLQSWLVIESFEPLRTQQGRMAMQNFTMQRSESLRFPFCSPLFNVDSWASHKPRRQTCNILWGMVVAMETSQNSFSLNCYMNETLLAFARAIIMRCAILYFCFLVSKESWDMHLSNNLYCNDFWGSVLQCQFISVLIIR